MKKENQVTTQIQPHMTDSCEMSKVSKSPQEETSQLPHCGSDVKSQPDCFLVKWSFPQPQNVIPVWSRNVVSSSEKLYGGKQPDSPRETSELIREELKNCFLSSEAVFNSLNQSG